MIQKKYLDLEGLSSYTTKIKNYVASLLTKYAPMDNSAGAWNGIYHRKNLLDEFSLDELSSKIASGDFSGIPIGSYMEVDIKPNVDGAVLALSGNSTSGTTAYDISGNANNATMNNVSIDSETDKSFSFDGTANSYIDINNVASNLSNLNAISFFARIKTTKTGLGYVLFMQRSGYMAFEVSVANNGHVRVAGRNNNNDTFNYSDSPNIVTDGNLHTIAGILKSSEGKIEVYVDGVKVSEGNLASSGVFVAPTKCYISSADTNVFLGTMKGIKIYPRALSAEEITQLHNATQDEGLTERVRWLVAGLNNLMNTGDVVLTDNHLTMVAEDCLKNTAKMNPTSTTGGGFASSEMFAVVLSRLSRNVLLTVGANHFINQRELVSSSVSDTLSSMAGAGLTGASNSWIWVYGNCNLMTEVQLYGATFFSSSYYDVGTGSSQFPLFRLAPYLIEAGRGIDSSALKSSQNVYWLRSVASKNQFCTCNGHKYPSWAGATTSYGIRPYFLFK